jgi:hypothetical protein
MNVFRRGKKVSDPGLVWVFQANRRNIEARASGIRYFARIGILGELGSSLWEK